MSESRRHHADQRPPGSGPDTGARGQPRGRQRPPGRPPRRWGGLSGRAGAYIVMGGAALGAVVTAASGSEPGFALGAFLVAGTAAAALAVRPRAVYRIIPVPALAYLVAAAVSGLISDRATDTSAASLAISAAQWIASGFFAMTAATMLVIVMTVARWHKSRRGPRGRFYRPPAAGDGSPRRPPADQGLSALRGMRAADHPASAATRRRRSGRPGS